MSLLGVDCLLETGNSASSYSDLRARIDVASPRRSREIEQSEEIRASPQSIAAPPSPTFDLDWEEWDGKMPFWKHALAGSCAGIMEHLGMFPLDTLKTHMQVLRPGASATTGMGDALKEIVGNGGSRGFMRGCSAIALGTVPAHIGLFSAYEFSKSRLLDGRDHDPARAAVCGAVSQFTHDLFLTPADVVKQRMQLGCSSSISRCFTNIVRREGAAALFRSMPTTLAMNVPFGSVLVATNESLKHALNLDESSLSLPLYFVSAGISGGIAAAVTQPLDVVKTRLQTQDCLAHDSKPSTSSSVPVLRPKYSGFVGTFKTIMREEGASAFLHGLAPRVLYTMPAAAICWGTYDSIKSIIMRDTA
jgi:solute carrier family 25 iron transporter 28/37